MKRLSISFVLFLFFVLIIILAQGLFAQPTPNPTDGQTGVSINPTFSFGDYDTPPYIFHLQTAPIIGLPGTIVHVDSTITGTQASVGFTIPVTLDYNRRYQWCVKASPFGSKPWYPSSGYPGYLFTTVLATPQLVSPANGSSFSYTSPVTFNWTQADNKSNVKYTIDVSTQGGANFDPNIIHTYTTPINPGSLSHSFNITSAGTYYWRVKAIVDDASADNDGETTTSSIFSFTMTLPGPTLVSPVNGLTGVSVLPTLRWNSVSGAASYKLFVDDSSTFSTTLIFEQNVGTDTSKTFNALIPNFPLTNGQTYYWKVAAVDINGTEYPSATWHFTVAPGFTVYQHTPGAGQVVYPPTVNLGWSIGHSANNLTFEIQYLETTSAPATESDWSGAIDSTVVGTNASSYTKQITVKPGRTYYWRVLIKRTASGEYVHYPAPNVYNYFVTEGDVVVPTPNWPVGGVYIYNTNPQLSWYLNPYKPGLTYDVDFATSLAGLDGTPDYTVSNPNQMYYQLSGLTPGQTYYWRVRSQNSAGDISAWSSPASFTIVGGTTLSYAVAGWPIGGATEYTNTPWLSWYLQGSSLGLTDWYVKYKKGSAPADWITYNPASNDADGGKFGPLPLSTTGIQLGTFPGGLTWGATYYWAVYPAGATSVNPLGVGNFVIVGGPDSTTIALSNPADGSTITTTDVWFNWYVVGSSQGIVEYELVYSKSDVFHPSVTDTVTGITTQSYQVTGLDNGFTYYWKVRAKYFDGSYTAYSTVFSFTVQEGANLVVKPEIGSPHLVLVPDNTITFSWISPLPPAPGTKYELQYSTVVNFANPVTVTDITQQQVTVSDLIPNTQYFWRVRAKSPEGVYSFYSDRGRFAVESATSVKEENEYTIPDKFTLHQNYPNPFNPSTIIAFDLPEDANVTLSIFNILGQEVLRVVDNEILKAGNHRLNVNMSNLPSGTYFYRLESQKFSSVKKMILVK